MGILYHQKDPKEELVILGMEQKMMRILWAEGLRRPVPHASKTYHLEDQPPLVAF